MKEPCSKTPTPIIDKILEEIKWSGIEDCKKYQDLLESDDDEIFRLAIELLKADKIDLKQIVLCEHRFKNRKFFSFPMDYWF